jgi:hypothetical protein
VNHLKLFWEIQKFESEIKKYVSAGLSRAAPKEWLL